MGGRAGQPEAVGGNVSFGLAVKKVLCDGVHHVCMPLVVCEERPDEARQSGGGRVGLEDVLGGGDWHRIGGRRGGIMGGG